MNKIQKFLFSIDQEGNKFIIHTRDPLCIFYLDGTAKQFKLLTADLTFQAPDTKIEGLTKRANDWYVYTILNKPK